VEIPDPIEFKFQFWDAAYHVPKVGNPLSMKKGMEWAVSDKDLRGNGLESVYVIGEAVGMGRGWVEGEYFELMCCCETLMNHLQGRLRALICWQRESSLIEIADIH
jgi:hypothetical protein